MTSPPHRYLPPVRSSGAISAAPIAKMASASAGRVTEARSAPPAPVRYEAPDVDVEEVEEEAVSMTLADLELLQEKSRRGVREVLHHDATDNDLPESVAEHGKPLVLSRASGADMAARVLSGMLARR